MPLFLNQYLVCTLFVNKTYLWATKCTRITFIFLKKFLFFVCNNCLVSYFLNFLCIYLQFTPKLSNRKLRFISTWSNTLRICFPLATSTLESSHIHAAIAFFPDHYPGSPPQHHVINSLPFSPLLNPVSWDSLQGTHIKNQSFKDIASCPPVSNFTIYRMPLWL